MSVRTSGMRFIDARHHLPGNAGQPILVGIAFLRRKQHAILLSN